MVGGRRVQPADDDSDLRLLGRLALRRRGRRRISILEAVAALVHELIELGAILCETQTLKEFLELALLFFQAAQRLGAIIVERPIAA